MFDNLAYDYVKEKYYEYLCEIKNNNLINYNIKKFDIYKDYVKKCGKRIKKSEFEKIIDNLINDIALNHNETNIESNKNINESITIKSLENIDVVGFKTMKEIGIDINKIVDEKKKEREEYEINSHQYKISLIEKIKLWWKKLFIVQFFQYKKITKDIDEIIRISINSN